MKRFFIAVLLLLGSICGASAQQADMFCWVPGAVSPNNWVPCSSTTPLQVTGTFSASIAGFAPGGAYANLTSTALSADVALPTGTVVVAFNTGTTAVSCTFTIGAGSSVANHNVIQASSSSAFTVGSNTHVSCINQAGDAANNVVVFSGGSGLATGWGGGGGGFSTVTANQGTANATPWNQNVSQWGGSAVGAMANYGTSPGAVLVPGVNAFVTNANANVPNNTDAQAASATAGSPVVNYGYGFNGATWDRLQVDGSKNLKVTSIITGTLPGFASTPTVNAAQSGTWSNVGVNVQAVASGGWSSKWFIAANSDNATNLKNSAGIVHAVQIYGIGSTPAWLKFYDTSSSPTCNSSTIVKQLLIPANSTAANGAGNNAQVIDKQFTTGISYCVVTGIAASDDTAVAAATYVVNIDYQ
jgi:hypothetical protein